MFKLPTLPYSEDALEPYISKETLHFHYHKHHKGYIDKLNNALEDAHKSFQTMPLDQLLINSDGELYNLAAQAWNHTFYWMCMNPAGGGSPEKKLTASLVKNFGSVTNFTDEFKEAALNQFGSGWAWLVKEKQGQLAIKSTTDAVNPLSKGDTPLLTIDVWEHAYYLDYQNKRNEYIDNFMAHLINWTFVEKRLEQC